MTITAATIALNRTHYVADDTDAGTMTVTLTFTGGTSGDPYTVRILRRGYEAGEFLVHSEARTFSTSPESISWRLATFRDEHGNYAAPCSRTRNDYRLEVVVNDVVLKTAVFSVSPLSVEEMRGRWCRGLPLSAPDNSYVTDDTDIIEICLHAYHQMAFDLTAYPEPVRIVSPLLVEKGLVTAYDVVKNAADYLAPPTRNTWLTIRTPTPGLLTVHQLAGWINQEKTITFSREWIVINEKTGLISLVPSNTAIVTWTFYSPSFMIFFANRSHIPNFWQFEVTAGLRSMPVPISEFIARAAAVELLSQVSQAIIPTGGIGLSLSRDGVTESRSLNPRGAYQALIENFYRMNNSTPEKPNAGLRALRARYFGFPMGML